MTSALAALIVAAASFVQPAQSPPGATVTTSADVIAEARVHGNHLTTDAEILELSGITIGAPFGPDTIKNIHARLEATGRFRDVEVLKRFASIIDPSQIVVVILVNEGPVRVEVPDEPNAPIRVVKRRGPTNVMYAPMLNGEDGYGLTYGVRVAYVGIGGPRGRVSFPLTWGGTKRAGAEFDWPLSAGPFTRVQIGSAVERRHNPAFDLDDDRTRVWGRVERAIGPLRIGGLAGWQHLRFADLDDRFRSAGVDVTFDTRVDPVLPRNAVYATASWTTQRFDSGLSALSTRLDGRGYVGLVGQSVLVMRATREDSDRPLPPYLKPLLGGWSNLRGFEAGAFVGDTLVAGLLELRLPLSSPLSIGRMGVSAFVDTGKVYDTTERFRDRPLRTGIGGGVWFTVTAFQLGISVAHGRGADTRVNFGAGLTF